MLPRALAAHVDRFKALPSQGGLGGPGSAAEENFFARAFPDNDIPLERLDAARAAVEAAVGKGFPTGKGRPGTWVTIGPSNAIYPVLRAPHGRTLRAERVRRGRTRPRRWPSIRTAATGTAGCGLARPAAASGGPRTRSTGQPNWEYLSGPFAINSIGSIALDPNDPSGDTIWVGTGESNACGSGCVAGVGLYRVDRRRRYMDRSDRQQPCSMAAASARSPSSPAIRTRSTRPHARPPRTLVGLLRRRGHTDSGRGALGALPIGRRGRDVDARAQRRADRGWLLQRRRNVANNLTPCSPRGVRRVAIDPSSPSIVYATSYARGVWRSSDNGTTWSQIFLPIANGATTGFTRAARDLGQHAAERQDAHVSWDWNERLARQPAVSER